MPTNFDAIPVELRELKQWLLWRREIKNDKPTKVPYSIAHTLASVNEPKDWSSFNDVKAVFQFGGYDGIGFVFTNTEYSGIDLDDCSLLLDGSPNPTRSIDLERQIKIFNEFDSYSERSPSGNGLHIIVKGSVSSGKKRSFVELYSTGRYFTMTGDIFNNKPIIYRQDLLTQLWNQMGGNKPILSYATNEPQIQNDEEIINIATNADNGYKFTKLYNGEWQEFYPAIAAAGQGSSEACLALIDIISFYSKNMEQIERIFMCSKLGNVEKYRTRRDLVIKMIEKSFDKAPLKIDFQNYAANIDEQLALPLVVSDNGSPTPFDGASLGSNPSATAKHYNGSVAQWSELSAHNTSVAGSSPAASTISFPPGLVGEIAQFIYDAAPRQVKEIAIGAALGLMAGTCGRAFNINGTGLNLYILILAKTGRGKEAAASGIDKIMNEVKKSVPTSGRFRGPGIINSGQALIKHFAHTSNCFVSVLGEFGLTIDRISHPSANSADKMLYQMLLDLYNKSGFGQTLQASIYSNKEDNVGITNSPTVSILGESTPKLFYDVLTENMIAAGLLPRFLIIEYNGKREYLNEKAASTFPDLMLIQKFSELVAYSETIQHNQKVTNINMTEDAVVMLRKLDWQSTDNINVSDDEVIAELWNRAHMKVMRIAALIAVGVNPYNPLVTVEYLKWAKDLVEYDVKALSSKFESGEVGNKSNIEQAQINEVLKKIKQYFEKDWDYVKKYSRIQSLHSAKIISYEYLNKRLSQIAVFYGDRKIKVSVTIDHVLKLMIGMGILKECTKVDLKDHSTEQKAYILVDYRLLSEINVD